METNVDPVTRTCHKDSKPSTLTLEFRQPSAIDATMNTIAMYYMCLHYATVLALMSLGQ